MHLFSSLLLLPATCACSPMSLLCTTTPLLLSPIMPLGTAALGVCALSLSWRGMPASHSAHCEPATCSSMAGIHTLCTQGMRQPGMLTTTCIYPPSLKHLTWLSSNDTYKPSHCFGMARNNKQHQAFLGQASLLAPCTTKTLSIFL